MDNKSAGTAVLGKIVDIDLVLGVGLEVDKSAVTGWNGGFST